VPDHGDGDVVSFEHHMACSELDFRFGLGDAISTMAAEHNNEGFGQYIFFHTVKLPYKTGVTTLSLKQQPLAKPTGTWRNVYSGQVGAINEIVIHELAGSVGKDEVDFRMNLLENARAKAVLEKVAQEGQWGRTLPAGVAYTSVEIKINYLRPVHGHTGELTAHGWVTKPGRQIAFAEGDVRDSNGKVVATASSTCLILPAAPVG